MNQIEIVGIRKPSGIALAHEAISHYQWKDSRGAIGFSTRQEMLNWYDAGNGKNIAFVLDDDGINKVYCGIRQLGSTRFLQTYSDETYTNNLLDLPMV